MHIMGNSTMSIRMGDRRERLYDDLKDATGENTRAGALDAAARLYVAMAGGTTARPTGALEELLERADDQGAVTLEELVDVLDTEALPLEYSSSWSVGGDE